MPKTQDLARRLSARDSWTATGHRLASSWDMIGARSAFLILHEAFSGTTRFGDFVERVGISEAVAAARLRRLVEQGILVRENYRQGSQRTRQEYLLTDKGADLFPVVEALMQWGHRWAYEEGGPRELGHQDCVHATGPNDGSRPG